MSRPVIGISMDVEEDRLFLRPRYARSILQAGGLPLLLPPAPGCEAIYLERCDAVILSGGDDPDTRQWGEPIHPEATPIHPDRQAAEWALLDALVDRPEMPVLGICLGMQMMAIHAGGRLEQHLPDVLPTADAHWGGREHSIEGDMGTGTVLSHHRQAITDAGGLEVVATAADGVIEAVRCARRDHFLGVQWHPERTDAPRFGPELFECLVGEAGGVGPVDRRITNAVSRASTSCTKSPRGTAQGGGMDRTSPGLVRKRTIDDTDVTGRRVLMRVDFNVPLDDDGAITDDRRIRLALPSIRSVIDRGGRLILMSHLGRPSGGGIEPAFSLRPVAERLRELLDGVTVHFPGDMCVGEESERTITSMEDGEIVVLENLRFHPGEKSGDAGFAAELASNAEIYCNDAFGTAHREDASMVAVPRTMEGLPRVCGLLMVRELEYLDRRIREAAEDRPEHEGREFVAVLGGAKVSDKLGAIRNLLERVDVVLVGGAMAYTLVKARGGRIGASRYEAELVTEAREVLDAAGEEGKARIELPVDHVCAAKLEEGIDTEVHEDEIPEGLMGLDIGPRTTRAFGEVIGRAHTLVWNGPMGVFEVPPFDAGTRKVAEAMAEATDAGAVSIVGGGDSAAAVEAFDLADRFSHVSTGGGASLAMLEGRTFESVELLDDA